MAENLLAKVYYDTYAPRPTSPTSLDLTTSAMLTRAIYFSFVLYAQVLGTGFADPNSGDLSFERDIRPILKAHCFQCHGEGGVVEGSLDVRLRRSLVQGGESGQAIQPGKPDDSLLLKRVEQGEMPPEDKHLSPDEIAKLRHWISQGANTNRPEPEAIDDTLYITEEEKAFWSFQPIRRPSLPAEIGNGVNNPIDGFVLQKLHALGLEFSPAADAHTLIRRATFDLWGLPPDPAMVDAFVQDQSPDAFEKLIDRLLADSRYGERWGRHWLDVAGYADSEGYSNQDAEREFAYFYRDYVIQSFNDDKPLDEFVCEQLAGDEMPLDAGNASDMTPERIQRLAATGLLRMAPDGTANAGSERDLAANETIAETINIVSTSLLGLTVGCARCHDHRYDPISQADYYQFRAIFEPALDWKQWKVPNERHISLYTAADHQARATVEAQAKLSEAARTDRQRQHIARTLTEELLVAPDDKRESLRFAFETSQVLRTPEQIALLEEFPNIGNISPGSLYLYAEQRARRATDIEQAAAQRESRFIAQVRESGLQELSAVAQSLVRILETQAESQSDLHPRLRTQFPRVFVSAQTLSAFDPDAAGEIRRYREAAQVCRNEDAKTELAKLQEEINAIRLTAPKENFIRALTEPANHTPKTHLFIRGDHNQPGQELSPAELHVLRSNSSAELPVKDPNLATSGRRLAYARHLVDGQHPLLARVLVNRVWLHHFGRGIVETPGDFGMLGARPSHPELLDWLADELTRSGWQLKRLHRMMMLSQTYQQSSGRSEQLDQLDPENRWLARMPVRRLESEAIRDATLVTSGTLLQQMFGPPIPVKEDSVGQIVLGKEALDGERKPTAQDPDFEGAARRSLYIQVRRTRPLAVLETFDIATVSPNCTQRNYSNVATQSLLMMNSQFVVEHAEKMANSLGRSEAELPHQLALAWKRCFCRDIEPQTLQQLEAFTHKQAIVFQAQDEKMTTAMCQSKALASVCQALLCSNEFIYVD